MSELYQILATTTGTGSGSIDIWELIKNANIIVQVVMGILVLGSLLSWTMIFSKSRSLKLASREADAFEQRFWSGSDLGAIYKQVATQRHNITGMESIFEAGFKEFARLRKQSNARPMAVVEGSHRAMRVALARELEDLENNLSFLATVGSTSPYIGLLGTVVGIMGTMNTLKNASEASISKVAPGISEALFATALGLVAAIPAVMAYNKFSNEVERLTNRYNTFVEEFATILQRHAHE
ncbi:Tol-Pal system protein TolQ [hydrothermal vent metagenome]|uniref:Tol-Pal system protein TolQ n=1 Tax=hydrothermal vent metagenome TaxID=652676 RepID=A0A3B0YYZ6_9ZZZZ